MKSARAKTEPPPKDVTGRLQRALLDLLSDGRWHPYTELNDVAGPRYSARVMEVRDKGFNVEKMRGAGSVRWYYRLKGTAQMRLFLLLLLLAGCGTSHPNRIVSVVQAVPDSVRWVAFEPDPNDPTTGIVNVHTYALTWSSGTMNLWTENWFLRQINAPFGEVYPYHYGITYRASLPAFWQSGDTIRGTWCAASPDTAPVVGGSMWAVVQQDTMRGQTIATVQTFGGARSDTLPYKLVRVRP